MRHIKNRPMANLLPTPQGYKGSVALGSVKDPIMGSLGRWAKAFWVLLPWHMRLLCGVLGEGRFPSKGICEESYREICGYWI